MTTPLQNQVGTYETLFRLFSPPTPNKPRTVIKHRVDEVYHLNIRGVIFLLCQNDTHSIVWLPYATLCCINEDHVVHQRSNGELVTKLDFVSKNTSSSKEKSHSTPSLVSAQLQEPSSPSENTPKTIPVLPPYISQCAVILLSDVNAIKRHLSSISYSHLVIFSTFKSSPDQEHPQYREDGPFLFYDGGCSEFVAALERYVSLEVSPSNHEVFKVREKSETLQHSLRQMNLDDYFDDIFADNHQSGSTKSWLEWGTKFKQGLQSGFQGYTKYFKNQKQPKSPKKESKKNHENANTDESTISEKSGDFDFVLVDRKDTSNETQVSGDEKKQPATQETSPNRPKFHSDQSQAITREEWETKWLNSDGSVSNSDDLRKEIFYRGIGDDARCLIWPFLVNFFDWNSTSEERKQLMEKKTSEYNLYRAQWQTITPQQEKNHSKYRERKHRIEKDVVRTDRQQEIYKDDESPYLGMLNRIIMTYSFYNFDLSYCQGMSDFASVILSVIRKMETTNEEVEVLSFWTFATLMDNRVHINFEKDSKGMEKQLEVLVDIVKILDYNLYLYFQERDSLNLFFCFRWIIVHFKREFPFDDIERMWEALWTDQWGKCLHLFMCYSIIEEHRKSILEDQMSFDEILRFCVNLSNKMDVGAVMERTLDCVQEYERTTKKRLGDMDMLSSQNDV